MNRTACKKASKMIELEQKFDCPNYHQLYSKHQNLETQIQKRNGRKNHSEYHCSRDKVIFYFYERRSGKSPQKEPPSMLGESTNIRFFFRIVAKAKNSQHSVLLPNCCKGKEILRTFNNTINSVEQSNSFAHIQ